MSMRFEHQNLKLNTRNFEKSRSRRETESLSTRRELRSLILSSNRFKPTKINQLIEVLNENNISDLNLSATKNISETIQCLISESASDKLGVLAKIRQLLSADASSLVAKELIKRGILSFLLSQIIVLDPSSCTNEDIIVEQEAVACLASISNFPENISFLLEPSLAVVSKMIQLMNTRDESRNGLPTDSLWTLVNLTSSTGTALVLFQTYPILETVLSQLNTPLPTPFVMRLAHAVIRHFLRCEWGDDWSAAAWIANQANDWIAPVLAIFIHSLDEPLVQEVCQSLHLLCLLGSASTTFKRIFELGIVSRLMDLSYTSVAGVSMEALRVICCLLRRSSRRHQLIILSLTAKSSVRIKRNNASGRVPDAVGFVDLVVRQLQTHVHVEGPSRGTTDSSEIVEFADALAIIQTLAPLDRLAGRAIASEVLVTLCAALRPDAGRRQTVVESASTLICALVEHADTDTLGAHDLRRQVVVALGSALGTGPLLPPVLLERVLAVLRGLCRLPVQFVEFEEGREDDEEIWAQISPRIQILLDHPCEEVASAADALNDLLNI